MNAPFLTAEAAWLHTVAVFKGATRQSSDRETADGVLKALDRLYRERRIDLRHAQALRIYAERGAAPSPRVPAERNDHRLWREALDALEERLTVLGIVRRLKVA